MFILNYYSHHIGDFIKDTNYLTHEQRSIYLSLIWLYYDQEKPLDKDLDIIAMKVKATKKQIELLLKIFFIEEEDCYRHSRCDNELEKVYNKSEKARQNVQKRWDKEKKYKRNTNVILPNTQNPIPKTQVNKEKSYKDDPKFMEFWNTYAHKVGAVEAYKVWVKDKCEKQLDVIKKHIAVYHASKNWKEGFRKDPRTYLNQKMYLDDVTGSTPKIKGRVL